MQAEEIVYSDGDSFFNDIFQAFANAKNSIHFETYIFERDHIGTKVLTELVNAVKRGVKVRLLIDGVGSSQWTFNEAEYWRSQGLQLKFFHALPWQKHPYKVFQSLTLKRIMLGFSKANHRNHRKVCIIDDKVAFIGSMNVSDRHLPSQVGAEAWRDSAVRISNGNIERYIQSCKEAWYYSQRHYGHRWLKIAKQKRRAHKEIIYQLGQAAQRIWITNPYFVPDFKLVRTLCRASKRGVDVKILVPKSTDVIGLKFAMEGYYTLFLTFGIQIYEYEPSMLHAKVLIIDNWVSLGSTNLDKRSIFYNLEVDAILTNQNTIHRIQNQFIKDLEASSQIEFNVWKKRSWFNRQLERFFSIFRGLF